MDSELERLTEALQQVQQAMEQAWHAIVEQVRAVVRVVVAWARRNWPFIREIRYALGIRRETIMTRKIRRYVRTL